MVTAQGHELGLRSDGGRRGCSTKLLEGQCHLRLGNVIVKWRDGNVATVNDLGPAQVRIDVGSRVEGPEAGLPRGGMADCPRSEPSA